MTTHFQFDELTWPEVAELDKDTPLVLPLGIDYSKEEITLNLKSPEKIGWLPGIPYGWKDSGFELEKGILREVIANILGAYREDGFPRTFLLVPSHVDLELGDAQIKMATGAVCTNALLDDNEKMKVVLVPFGQTEQHGFHLPLSTDTICIDAVCKGVIERIPDKSLMLPTFPYGVSTHRKSFAGTTSINGRTFEDLCVAIADKLADRGFQMLYYLSGHGGNVSFLVNAIKYIGDLHPDIFCATTWLYLSGPKGQQAISKHRQSKVGGMGHACELETSLILHLRPELTHMDRVVDEIKFISTSSYYQDWIEGGALVANPPWKDDTATGSYGAGSLGTAEKGKIWLDVAIEEKIDHVQEIMEQQNRRAEKRKRNLRS